jgi:hypothetical protein
MKYLFLFVLLSFFSLFCSAQDAADLPPKITYHPSTVHNWWDGYYTLGDEPVTDQELGHYLQINYPIIAGPYRKGMKAHRNSWKFFALGVGGAALGLLTKPRQLDYIGYGGFLLGTAAGFGLSAWGNRKMGEGIYYYNQERERMLEELQRPSVYEQQKRRIEVLDIE